MFRKLRLKLTLINLGIIASLFLILTVGTFIFAQDRLKTGAFFFMEEMARNATHDRLEPFMFRDAPIKPIPEGPLDHILPSGPPGEKRPMRNVFYVKVTPAGRIIEMVSQSAVDRSSAQALTAKTYKMSQPRGEVSVASKKYLYLRQKVDQTTLIVFHDFSEERAILETLILALGSTGLLCLVISLFASLFLANRALVPIQTAWDQQKNFLADASHELRTPLFVIQTNMEVVMEDDSQTVGSQRKWLTNIKDEVTWMSSFVDSLLFLARSDSHQMILEEKTFNLNKAINGAVEPFKPLIKSRGLSLSVTLKDSLDLYGDESKIKQLVGILLDNAIKYTPKNGQIEIELKKSGNYATMTVDDTGIGISEQERFKIFDRFYQIDKSRSKKGAGLGLSIAKWIVDNHNGYIQVSSLPGQGTTFEINLLLDRTGSIRSNL